MDRGQSAQVKKFEGGSDYLFFQGPSPLYAVQEDLPGVLTGVRTAMAHGAQLRALIVHNPRAGEPSTLTHAQVSSANGGGSGVTLTLTLTLTLTHAQENLAAGLENAKVVQLGAAAVAGVATLAAVGQVLLA